MEKENDNKDKKIEELEKEKNELQNTIKAYESLRKLSSIELDDAYKTINAYEQVQELSRQELLDLKEELGQFRQQMHDKLEKEIINLLNEYTDKEQYIVDKVYHMQQKSGNDFYKVFLKILTNLDFSPNEAKEHWDKIMLHQRDLKSILGRDISFRVAMLDYFININRRIKNPIIIEIKLYEKTVLSSLMDLLTGVFNRRYYDDVIEREINRAKRHHRILSLLVLDLDDFKKVNDEHGHLKGDMILKNFGRLLRETFRKEDVICRYGGEEFSVVMPDTSAEGALTVVGRLRKDFKRLHYEENLGMTFSGGIATFPSNASDKDELFNKADLALYKAKETGKDKVLIFDLSIEK